MLAIILVLVISIGILILADVVLENGSSDAADAFAFFGSLSGIAGLIVFGAMVIIAIVANIGIKGQIAENEKRYESLVYQLENNLYDNDNDIGKKELYNQIQEWNEDLANGKALQHDIWVGIFYPNIYDHFEFIELK